MKSCRCEFIFNNTEEFRNIGPTAQVPLLVNHCLLVLIQGKQVPVDNVFLICFWAMGEEE